MFNLIEVKSFTPSSFLYHFTIPVSSSRYFQFGYKNSIKPINYFMKKFASSKTAAMQVFVNIRKDISIRIKISGGRYL